MRRFYCAAGPSPSLPIYWPRISTAKIALITNSNIAQSASDAADYATRRGLTGPTLSFNLGTSNTLTPATLANAGAISCQSGPYAGQSVMQAIANAIVDNALECVITSTYTPGIVGPAPVRGLYSPLASYLGSARYWNANGMSADFPSQTVATDGQTIQAIAASLPPFALAVARNGLSIPHGRLGCPDNQQPGVVEVPRRSGGSSIYTTAVLGAMAAEGVSHLADTHLLSSTLSYGDHVVVASNRLVYTYATAHGIPCRDLGIDPPFANGAGGPGNFDGTYAPPFPIFGYCVGAPWNPANWNYGTEDYVDNYSVIQGGWWYDYTSYAGQTGTDWLWNGGSVAFCTAKEPLATGLPGPQHVFALMVVARLQAAAANFFAKGCDSGGWDLIGTTVCGDPLAELYKATPIL